MQRRLVAFVVADTIGPLMAGPAIRALALAREVQRVADVVILARHAPMAEPDDLEVRVLGSSRRDVEGALRDVDVLVVFGSFLTDHPWVSERADVFVVVDAYDPAPLEALVQHAHEPRARQDAVAGAARGVEIDQLRRADLVLCASERQRHLRLGQLLALGRVNPDTFHDDHDLARLVQLVPFGTAAEPFAASRPGSLRRAGLVPEDAFVLLWGGGVYEWLDPELLVEAVAAIDDATLVAHFMGVRHPSPDVPAMPVAARVLASAERHGLLGSRVLLADGWTPHAARADLFADADVGVSLHHQHVETTFAFRTRLLDYLWAGLPILCSDGDELADLVRRADLGEVVAPGDLDGLVGAIGRLRDPARRQACGARASVAGADRTWASVAGPLVDYCADPWRAPDLVGRRFRPRRAAGAIRRLLDPRR